MGSLYDYDKETLIDLIHGYQACERAAQDRIRELEDALSEAKEMHAAHETKYLRQLQDIEHRCLMQHRTQA